jgi:integrase
MAVRQRGSGWQADIMFRRQRFRHTFSTQNAAEEWELAAKKAKRAGQPPPEPANDSGGEPAKSAYTLRYVLDAVTARKWAGSKSESTSVKNAEDCVAFFGEDTPVGLVSTESADALVAHFKAKGLTDRTVNRKLAALSVLLHFSEDRGWIAKRPKLERRKESQGRIRVITYAEEQTILDVLEEQGKDDFRDFFQVLIDSGVRLSEGLGLKWADIDEENLYLWDTKAGTNRSVPMSKRVKIVLAQLRRGPMQHEEGPFASLNKWSCQWAWGGVRDAMNLRGDKHFVIHACRHTFCTRCIQAGVPVPVVKELAGHSCIATTMRYVHMSHTDKREAIEKMQGTLRITPPIPEVRRVG